MKNLPLSFFVLLVYPAVIYGYHFPDQDISWNDTTLIFAEFCEGSSYEWNGVSYDQPGEYVNVLIDTSGMDSVVILTLGALASDTTQLDFVICSRDLNPLTGEEVYHGSSQEEDSISFDEQIILSNQYGCDSVVMAHIIVYPELLLLGWAYVPYGYIVNGEPLYYHAEICTIDTTSFGCPDIACFTYYVEASSTDELEKELELQIYPNPVEENVNVGFLLSENLTIQISVHDTAGRKLEELMGAKQLTAGQHNLNFDLSELPSSMYFLKMQVDGVGLMKR